MASEKNNLFSGDTLHQIQQLRHQYKNQKIGFTCSCFYLLHSGHAIMLKDSRSQCDVLVVGLQTDPTIDRSTKNKPVLSFEERKTMIEAIRYVDHVIDYATEHDLYRILEELKPHVRILGSDWQGKSFTGDDLSISIHWHLRDHPWSTSSLRERVWKNECRKRETLK